MPVHSNNDSSRPPTSPPNRFEPSAVPLNDIAMDCRLVCMRPSASETHPYQTTTVLCGVRGWLTKLTRRPCHDPRSSTLFPGYGALDRSDLSRCSVEES